MIPPLFLNVQHVHTQPAVTKASITMLIPNRAPRADVALGLAFVVGVPGSLQEQAPKTSDTVEQLFFSGRGVN